MAPERRRLLDTQGQVIIDGNGMPGYRTLEGPKFYKANGYYYVFAPAGGVEEGWQSVFRSRRIEGPYEDRIVMEQGATSINGPHQGAWVRAAGRRDWFLHFQDMEPMAAWCTCSRCAGSTAGPSSGRQPTPGIGQPVQTHVKPVAGLCRSGAGDLGRIRQPAPGLQWQWNANSDPRWYSLSERPGMLRLHTQAAPQADGYVRAAPALLTQKLPAATFVVNTHIQLNNGADGDRAGLILNAMQYAWLGLRKSGAATELVYVTCAPAVVRCKEEGTVVLQSAPSSLYLRMSMADGALASFSYSTDNVTFVPVGSPFAVSKGRWVGAQVGLFSVGAEASSLDVDYFRVTAP